MESKFVVDILMATYNGALYVKEQIASIQNQRHQNWRLLVSDDSSTDNTWEILTEFANSDPRIVLLPRKERLGSISNFSRLMEHASAYYVMFSDQDDFWFPEKISKTLTKMREMEFQEGSSVPFLVHTDLVVVNHALKEMHPSLWKYSNLDSSRYVTLNRLLAQNVITGCTMMINRPLLEISYPIPREAVMHDRWIGLVAAAFGRIGIIPEATMAYRQHGKNQLGAKAYGFKRLWQNGLSALRIKKNEQMAQQANRFLNNYCKLLTESNKEILRGYCEFCQGSFWKKREAMIKFSFYKNGFLYNLYEFLR